MDSRFDLVSTRPQRFKDVRKLHMFVSSLFLIVVKEDRTKESRYVSDGCCLNKRIQHVEIPDSECDLNQFTHSISYSCTLDSCCLIVEIGS